MKQYIIRLRDSSFTDRQTGQRVEFRHALIMSSDKIAKSDDKGYDVIKVKIAPGVIDQAQPSQLPGWFECETGIGSKGTMIITKIQPSQD